MNVFEITIQHRQEHGWPVVTEHSRIGELPRRSEGFLNLPENYVTNLLMLHLDSLGYGTFLGEALFQGPVLNAFISAKAEAETTHEPLRILLVVEDPKLKSLRWERLCAPDSSRTWDFLALDQGNPFSLYLPSLTDRRFPAIGRRDLRALVLLASPPSDNTYDIAAFDAEAIATSVGRALGDIPFDLLGPVKNAIGPADKDTLYRQITEQQYTMLHVVAHGKYNSDGETILYLLTPGHQVAPLPVSNLIRDLKRLRGIRGLPHLAFLCTCESAKPESEPALGGFAQRLVRELGLPSVVAMTDPVSIATAEELAAAFYRRLREHGKPDQALTEASSGMMNRPDILVPALFSRLGGRSLFCENLERPLTNAEIEYGLERCTVALVERAPILLNEFTEHAKILSKKLRIDPTSLNKEARKQRDNSLAEINGLCEEALDISFPAAALGQNIPIFEPICPFPGLKAFQSTEQQFFFGRDQKIDELANRLRHERFLALLGASGSGKSSLVLAGIIPSLKKEKKHLQICYLTPGADPQLSLRAQLTVLLSGEPVLLVVDQFEELFTICQDIEKRKAFLTDLLNTWQKRPELHLILTLRADFWGDCAPYPEFKELMQCHQELLSPMTTSELRTSMEQQASSAHLRFEGGLSHTILSEIENEPGAMPLLQHLLLELWKRRHGRWLMFSEYEKLGGIKEAIGGTAEAIYDELQGDKEGKDLLRNIFVRLTRLGEADQSREHHRDTRQRVTLQELVPTGSSTEQVRSLIRRLADVRLLVTTVDTQTGETKVEVAHEALIRHWKRLRTWLNEDREDLIILSSVRQQAKDWEKNGSKEGDLPRWGEKLARADVLFSLDRYHQTALEKNFIQACKELAKKEKEQEATYLSGLKRRLAIAVAGIIATVILAIIAIIQGHKTEQQRIEANYNLAKTFEEKALNRLKDRHNEGTEAYKQTILFTWASLRKDILKDYDILTKKSVGTLLMPEVFQSAFAELWISPPIDSFSSISFSPDGKLLATASADRIVRIWNTKSGKEIRSLRGHNGGINRISFHPDGRILATASGDKTIRIWDIATGDELTILNKHDESVYGVSFSPDGKLLASSSRDQTIQVLDSESGQELYTLKGHEGPVSNVIFSQDGKKMASVSHDMTIRIWDSNTGNELHVLRGHTDSVGSAAFTPNGELLASASGDNTIKIWDTKTGEEIRTLYGHSGSVHSVAFSKDGKKLASSSSDKTIRIWDTNSWRETTILSGHKDAVHTIAFSPENKRLASASKDKTIRIWDSEINTNFNIINEKIQGTYNACFSFDGKWLALASEDNTIKILDGNTGEQLRILEGHIKPVYGVSFSPDGKKIASSSKDRTIRIWESTTGRQLTILKGHKDEVICVTFSPDGKKIASASRDKTVRIWNIETGQQVKMMKGHTESVYNVDFSPDGKRLASTSRDTTIRIWDSSSGQELLVLKGHLEGVNNAFFSPDGKRLVSSSWDKTVRIWDSQTGKQLNILEGHDDDVTNAVFSPDGSQIASASEDKTIRIWDSQTGKNQIIFTGHTGEIAKVLFSPAGDRLVSFSFDNTIRVWRLECYKLFWNNTKPTPLYYSFMEGIKAFWKVKLRGFEFVEHAPSLDETKKYGSLFAPPPPGQSKFDQVLEWAKRQQQ